MSQQTGFCAACNGQKLLVRKDTNHILHLLLSLITCFLWVPIWILSSVQIGGWRCQTCGGKCSAKVSMVAVIIAAGLLIMFVTTAVVVGANVWHLTHQPQGNPVLVEP